MIYIKPSFYNDFKCIASECTDNCCIGWEIDIDDDSFEKYNSLKGSLGDEIRSKITTSEDGSRCFELSLNDRCPFLNEQNLCRIIMRCGEDAICDICKNHPRFYEWFPGVTECGLGLSCEEVCRLLLSEEKPLELVEENDGEKISLGNEDDIIESDRYIFFSAFRERLFDVLECSELTLEEKMVEILSLTEGFCGEKIKIRGYEGLVEAYKKTEPIDENWTAFINNLGENLDTVLNTEDGFKALGGDMLYAKILAYIIYRHLIKAVFDDSIKERVCFCVESVRFIYLCDMKCFCEKGTLTLWDRIADLKSWSKQIEYSEENVDYLIYGD